MNFFYPYFAGCLDGFAQGSGRRFAVEYVGDVLILRRMHDKSQKFYVGSDAEEGQITHATFSYLKPIVLQNEIRESILARQMAIREPTLFVMVIVDGATATDTFFHGSVA